MAHQMIWQAQVADFDTWTAAFRDDHESREAAGLGTLQIWRGAEAPGTAWVLFRVSDPAKAQAFLGSPELALHRERAGVTALTATLLDTV